MLSQGGKREYLCPVCSSGKIFGPHYMYGQKSGSCNNCNQWFPWKDRLSIRAKAKKPAARLPFKLWIKKLFNYFGERS